jgi:hypothetical protein
MDSKTSSSLGSEIYLNGSNFSGSAKLVSIHTRKIVRNLFADIDFRHSAVDILYDFARTSNTNHRKRLFCIDFTFVVTRWVRRKNTAGYMGINYGTYVLSGVFPDTWKRQRIAYVEESAE